MAELSTTKQTKIKLFREHCEEMLESGLCPEEQIESVSAEYKMKLERIRGLRRGVDIISLAYLAIIGSQIVGSFMGVKVEIDVAFITVTCSAVTGLLGWTLGKTRKS